MLALNKYQHSRYQVKLGNGIALLFLVVMVGGIWLATTAFTQTVTKPYKVIIKDEKTEVVEPILPVDPSLRINLQPSFGMSYGLQTPDGKRLTFSTGSAQTAFKINGQRVQPTAQQQQLPPKKGSSIPRYGWMYSQQFNDVHVTQYQEVVPSKLPGPPKAGEKRKMDTVLFKYVIENKGTQDVTFGLRVRTDMYNWTTDGPAFWAPTTLPGKILDGVELTGKEIPDYLINIQNRDLQAPGHLAYYTFNQGNNWEKPSKVLVTSHGAADMGWEVQVTPGQFDTDTVLFWADKTLKPKQKRVIMYGYGTGIATSPENEGKITAVLGGSFEPNKIFTVTAYVDDPIESQSLALVLPTGVELLEGKETQPVSAPDQENRSILFWKGRILQPGNFSLQIQSSNGVTLTKNILVEKTK